jgi:uncharacterized protein
MKIRHEEGPLEGRFTAIENDYEVGVMTYHREGADQIAIDSTEVSPAFKEKGVGRSLVMEAVRFAREKHLKIHPMCWFVKLMLGRSVEFKDVLV